MKAEDVSSQHDKIASEELDRNGPPEKTEADKESFYQVLIDNRDIPYIRSQPESVTFLSGPQSNRTVYSIHGLDYVAHSDVLPYSSTEKTPIIHDLFEKFLMQDPDSSGYKKSFIKPFKNVLLIKVFSRDGISCTRIITGLERKQSAVVRIK